MTTAATVLAMIPLLIASGAGAGARFAMGLVIASGMTLGTLFTLFVVPAMYLFLAKAITPTPTEHRVSTQTNHDA
jgi:multidrug efflux pump